MGIQIETVKTETFSMDFFRFGQGEKILVILPGVSVQSVMAFASFVARDYKILADDYTIYVFDRRKNLPDSYPICEMARDTLEALKVLNLAPVSLFGASQGGMIAMTMAILQPSVVEKLILGSTSARIEAEKNQGAEEWIRLAKAGMKKELYLAFGKAVYPQDIYEKSRDLLAKAAKSITDEELERFIIQVEGLRGFDVVDDLDQITCPVLVIGSMDDQVLGPDASFEIARHLRTRKGLLLHMYDGYGHAVYDTAPDYKERILSFLQG